MSEERESGGERVEERESGGERERRDREEREGGEM